MILTSAILEEYVNAGILFKQILQASKIGPVTITFDNGLIRIQGVAVGTRGVEYTDAVLEYAVEKAYRAAASPLTSEVAHG